MTQNNYFQILSIIIKDTRLTQRPILVKASWDEIHRLSVKYWSGPYHIKIIFRIKLCYAGFWMRWLAGLIFSTNQSALKQHSIVLCWKFLNMLGHMDLWWLRRTTKVWHIFIETVRFRLICETPALLSGSYSQFWGPLLQALVGVFELPEDDSIPDDEHFIDIEDTPGYQVGIVLKLFKARSD